MAVQMAELWQRLQPSLASVPTISGWSNDRGYFDGSFGTFGGGHQKVFDGRNDRGYKRNDRVRSGMWCFSCWNTWVPPRPQVCLSSSCFARPGPKRCTNVLLLLLGELTVLHCSLILLVLSL